MRQPITGKYTRPPICQTCLVPLETAATAQNPSATITANSLARCPSCLVLYVVGADLRPSPDSSDDEAAFNAAMNANPEIEEWVERTLEMARIRTAAEIKAKCVAAREWLIARGGPDLANDVATLDAYAAGYDEKGYTGAPYAIRFRASGILAKMRRQRH